MAQTAVDIVVKASGLNKLDQISAKSRKSAKSVDALGGSIKRLGQTLAGLAVGDQLRRAFGAAAVLSGTEQRINNVTKKYEQFIGINKSAAEASKTFAISQQQALSDLGDLASRLGASGASLQDLENIYGGFNTLLLENAVGAQQAASAQLQLNQALGSGRLAGEEFNAINEATPQLLDEVASILGVARGELKKLASDGKISSQVLIQALTNIKTKGADALAASLDTPAGKLRQFDKAVKDFQVTVGQELLPVITPFIVEMTKLLKVFGELPGPVKTAVVGLTAVLAAAAALGPLLGVIAGGAKALGGGLLALGAGGSAGAGSLSLMTKALVILKGALIALPWVAAAAGVAALGKVVFDYYKKQADLNRLLNDATVKSTELKNAVSAKSAELEKASGKLDKMKASGVSNARAVAAQEKRVRELKAQLEALEGTYNVRVNLEIVASQIASDVEAQAKAAGGKAKGFDVLGAEGIKEAIARANGTFKETINNLGGSVGSGGSGGSGSGPSGPSAEDILRDQLKAGEEIERTLYRQGELKRASDQYDKELLQNAYDLDDTIRSIYETAAPSQRDGLIATATENARLDEMIIKAKQFGEAMGKDLAGTLPEVNNELSETDKLLKGAFDTVANGLTNGIKGLIQGTKDWSDILGNIANQLGSMLLNFAVKSIGSSLFPAPIPGFADGGRPPIGEVSLVGERGPELVKFDSPATVYSNEQSKSMLAQQNYSPANQDSSQSMAPLQVAFTSTSIRGEEYVTASQFRQGIQDATNQGAKQGEQRAMNKLRQSRSTRSKIGI